MFVFSLGFDPTELFAAKPKDTGCSVEGNIPLFSFENAVKLQVKVFDSGHREITDARFLLEHDIIQHSYDSLQGITNLPHWRKKP
jgi:hypothetical protein